ncbi:hypothetical protein [Photobacterium ganghwense]|uniref:hypothetical protein n=1 Tax=Photobacterium ganghwense TaxID=320778 RepID=UPI001472F44D|nr:hypothetical protein [Photobacterium ganghwense]
MKAKINGLFHSGSLAKKQAHIVLFWRQRQPNSADVRLNGDFLQRNASHTIEKLVNSQ